MSEWQNIESAPMDGRDIAILTAGGFEMLARWEPFGFINGDGEDIGSWVATEEGKHPTCWTDGACWESNENEVPSDPPIMWRPSPPPSPPPRLMTDEEEGMTVRELAPHEPFCPQCDLLRGDGVIPLCTCGRSVEERRAEGFSDAVGFIAIEWISEEEMMERYPHAKKTPPAPRDRRQER